MIKNILTDIAGIELFPIIALVLFLTVFVVITVRVLRMDQKHVDKMGSMPLDIDPDTESQRVAEGGESSA